MMTFIPKTQLSTPWSDTGEMLRLNQAKDAFLKQVVLDHATPAVKEPITAGKLKWRGVKIVFQPSTNKTWVEQRGEQIGPSFTYSVINYQQMP